MLTVRILNVSYALTLIVYRLDKTCIITCKENPEEVMSTTMMDSHKQNEASILLYGGDGLEYVIETEVNDLSGIMSNN